MLVDGYLGCRLREQLATFQVAPGGAAHGKPIAALALAPYCRYSFVASSKRKPRQRPAILRRMSRIMRPRRMRAQNA
jgi:hypothetical protein